MVEVEYQPLKKIIIHDVEHSPFEKFVEYQCSRGGTFGWCSGIVFAIAHFGDHKDIVRDRLDGIQHWQCVEFTELEKFKNELSNSKNLSCAVVDQSHNKVLVKAIAKVKEIWNESKN